MKFSFQKTKLKVKSLRNKEKKLTKQKNQINLNKIFQEHFQYTNTY